LKFHHVGIVVPNISNILKLFTDIFQIKETSIPFHDKIQRVNVVFLNMGNAYVELIEPVGTETPVTSFLDKTGGGIHHLAFEVDDIEMEIQKFIEKGGRVICNPVIGFDNHLISFVYLDSLPCKIIELVMKQKT
jgi:methylmalonyl-CoA epimerase